MIYLLCQADDGIRDIGVTGVQTCALPIWAVYQPAWRSARLVATARRKATPTAARFLCGLSSSSRLGFTTAKARGKIGRPSCRERVYISVGAVSLTKKPSYLPLSRTSPDA